MGIKKAYVAHDLSRKVFKNDVNRAQSLEKAKLWRGRYIRTVRSWKDDTLLKKPYVKRYYRRSSSSYIKRECNRRFRHSKCDCSQQPSTYRKCTEFW